MIFQKTTILVFTFLLVNTFIPSNNLDKLINNEIKSVFQLESFQKENIEISEELKKALSKDFIVSNFKKIKKGDTNLGFYYVGKAFGKVDYFDFIIIFDNELIVEKIKILIYREDHGGEIRSKRWLKQFIGKTTNTELIYPSNVVGISGATLSVKSMTNAVNNVLKSIGILQKNNII
jgi:hypothetical protein